MVEKLLRELKELGSQLESYLPNIDSLLQQLKHAADLLSYLYQSQATEILKSMQPFLKALINPELLNHKDKDVKLFVAACLCEITRITAPDAPYSDEIMKVIFGLIISTFSGLNDSTEISLGRREIILEILRRYRSCILLLDLECDDLVAEIFRIFIAVVRDDHTDAVVEDMKMIMVMLVEESDDVHRDIILTLLSSLGRNKKDINEAAWKLSMSVIKHCTSKLEPEVKQLLISSMSGESWSTEFQLDYQEVIFDLYKSSPEILSGLLPYLTVELLADESESRIRAVKLLGELFAVPDPEICIAFKPVFSEFLKRLADRIVEIRMMALDCVKNCLLSYPSRLEAPQIFAALHDRLLDYDENVRKQAVTLLCDVACKALESVPVETMKHVAERLRDKCVFVKKYTLERLAELYRLDCVRNKGCAQDYDWVPGKILRCFYDKDFRSDTVELVLCQSMVPAEFTIKQRVRQWIRTLQGSDKVVAKVLKKILEQKQRLQQEMQKYLTFKQTCKDSAVLDSQVKGMPSFQVLSRCFSDPEKAEENFLVLDQLKDDNIWNMLSNILDPDTSFAQALHIQDDVVKILGEKHELLDFMSTLCVKCSYILFSKEHVKEILSEVVAQKSAGDSEDVIISCIDILAMLAHYSPILFAGSEDELLSLLKEDNEIVKDGILNILAMAGGTIREGLASYSILVDLILERLCLGGTRRQAKYAVRALSAVTTDDGLLSLYKKLVDMLKERSNLRSVLQSLGCIAQTAPAVFKTRESEIVEFIKSDILQSTNNAEDQKKEQWHDGSRDCKLKIFAIKMLVKSFLPVKDAHLRVGIDNIIDILRSILSYGEISKEIKSSSVDRAHMRVASAKAVLRLSRHWDHKIPVDVFHLTVRTTEIKFPEARKVFRSKILQYLKDRALDARYACSLLFSIYGAKEEFEECKNDFAEVIQMCRQVRTRQLSMQSDANFTVPYPEFILTYLIHSLAHHPLFSRIEENNNVKPFEPRYRILFTFLSTVVHGGEPDAEIDEKAKECISVLTSILTHVKRSVDVVDASKSENSHAICGLGLSIIKDLTKQQDLHLDEIAPLTLPASLYKPAEKEDDCAAEAGNTTMAEDTVAEHFESLDNNGQVPPAIDVDETVGDGEIPLGKLIKRIKSEKVKARKAENGSSTDKVKIEEQEETISTKSETSNGNGVNKSKKMKNSDETPVAVPKRQRSTARKAKKDKIIKENNGDSELLLSCTGKKQKSPISSSDDEKTKGDNIENSSNATGNKRKRRSIKESSKSTENGLSATDLVGVKINVWWPLDKTFYEGTVMSYDTQKKEHVVLYDDGEKEELHLDEERWELSKKSKPSGRSSKKTKNVNELDDGDEESANTEYTDDESIGNWLRKMRKSKSSKPE